MKKGGAECTDCKAERNQFSVIDASLRKLLQTPTPHSSSKFAVLLQKTRRMATVLPPPSKRQRTDAADRAREQQNIEEIPSDAGTLRLQFFDETTGLPIGQGPILVPVADANPKNLELLLNALQGHVIQSYPKSRRRADTLTRTPLKTFPTDLPFQFPIREPQI